MSETWQQSPRGVAEQLVARGSVYDVDTMERIYDEDQVLLFVEPNGSVRRAGRAETIAMFRSWAEEGADPLLTEAEFLHIEQHEDHAVVLLRRRMRAEEPPNLYELRLRNHDGVWRVSGETITPWIADDRSWSPLAAKSAAEVAPSRSHMPIRYRRSANDASGQRSSVDERR